MRRAAWLGAGLLLAACTDPRARPVPPDVLLLAPAFDVTSPGTISASLYAFDADGLKDLTIHLTNDAGSFVTDSSVFLDATTEQTRPISLLVPAGLATGTRLTLDLTVGDYTGFATRSTTVFTVRDSVLAGH